MKVRGKISLLMICMLLMFLLSGCTVNVQTTLNVSKDFVGERVMTYTVAKSDVPDERKDELELVEQKIQQSHPEALECVVTEDESNYIYMFTLAFNSLEEYEHKVETLLGREVEISVEIPDTLFANGVDVTEDFESSELLGWVKPLIEAYNVSQEEAVDGAITLESLTSYVKNIETILRVEDDMYETSPHIRVQEVEDVPLRFIQIHTLVEEEKFLRKIEYGVSMDFYISKHEELMEYMDRLVPPGAYNAWDDYGGDMLFTIQFEAESMEKIGEMTQFALDSKDYALTEEVLVSDNPFREQIAYHEYIDLGAFSNNSEIKSYYSVASQTDAIEMLQIGDSVIRVEDVGGSEKARTLEINFGFEKKCQPYNIGSNTHNYKNNQISKTLLFEYGSDTPMYFMEQIKSYYDNHLQEGMTTEIIANNNHGYKVIVSISGELHEVNDILLRILGDGNNIKYQHDETKGISKVYQFEENVNLSNLFDADVEDISYRIDSENKERIQEFVIEEGSDAYGEQRKTQLPFESRKEPVIKVKYEGTKMNPVMMGLGILGAILIISCILLGFYKFINDLAKKEQIEYKSFQELLMHYAKIAWDKTKETLVIYTPIVLDFLVKTIKIVWRYVKDFYGVLKNMGTPNKERAPVQIYFYGHKWPKILCLLTILQLPYLVGTMIGESIGNRDIGMIFTMIGLAISGIGYAIDKFSTNAEQEEVIDLLMSEDMKGFTERALDKLGLVSESISQIEPIKVTGPYYKDETDNQEKSWVRDLCEWLKSVWIYFPKLIIKKGLDDKVRYSLVQVHIFMYSEEQIYVYCIRYDVCTGEIFEEQTTEYFYQNVQCIHTGQSLYKISQNGRKVEKSYEYFKVILKSGAYNKAVVDGMDSILSHQIMAMKALVREKKMLMKIKGEKNNE